MPPCFPSPPQQRVELLQIKPSYSEKINLLDSVNFYQALRLMGYSRGAAQLLYDTVGIDRGMFNKSYLELVKEMYMANFSSLFEIEGGMASLPHALLKELKKAPHVEVRMGQVITGIYERNLGVALRINHGKDAFYQTFDYIVCTLPFSRLRLCELSPDFSPMKMQAIKALNYSNAYKMLIQSQERFWESDGALGGRSITDLPITSLHYPSMKGQGASVFTASYTLGLDATRLGGLKEHEAFEEVKREVERVHGLLPNQLDPLVLDFKRVDWDDAPLALGAFAWFDVGQHRQFAYATQTPEYNQKVFFAGEHTSNLHAWMQGALQTGALTANRIAKQLMHPST